MHSTPGLFDLHFRFQDISLKGDPLENLARLVDFESFRPALESALNYRSGPRGGRPPYDVVLMFKILIVQQFYGIADDAMEFQCRDRLSFMRFFGLGLHKRVPDAKTIWLFRENLKDSNALDPLKEIFDGHLEAAGLVAKRGQMVDASFVPAPRRRVTREENEEIKAGKVPERLQKNEAALRQTDRDAQWAKKNDKAYFGYKLHINADAKHKIIRAYAVTDAAVHDSQCFQNLIDKTATSPYVYADSAYSSVDARSTLKEQGLSAQICHKGQKNAPLKGWQKRVNKRVSHVRCRVEHIFGNIAQFSGKFVRCIGMARARFSIGLQVLTYNIRRYVFLMEKAAI